MSKWILDASAVLALLNQEPGSNVVERALGDGASVVTVNLAEVVAKLADAGMPNQAIREALGALPISVVDFDEDLAYRTGLLRPPTHELGLSLGDRACLALAQRLRLPVLTTDHAWASLDIGVEVRVLR